jgi:hypothetical protein
MTKHNHHEDTIKFLQSLDHKACVFIFTKEDAEAFLPEGKEMTDESWNELIRAMQGALPDDTWWEYFGSFVDEYATHKVQS